jgi:RNA polymerase sigma factor (sigma-70 family)
VQEAFVRSLARMRTLQARGPQTLFAYFKMIVLNEIRDYARKMTRHPVEGGLDLDEHVHGGPSPLESAVGSELLERYQRALKTLSGSDQETIIAVVELRLTDDEIAELFEKPSANAARMQRARALARLGRAMEADKASPRTTGRPADRERQP